MKDNEREHNKKYERLASLLEEPQNPDKTKQASSDDEARKLLFVWNECRPAGADAAGVWEKTLQRIRQAEEQEAAGRRRRLIPVWRWVAVASVLLCVGLASIWFSETEVTVDERSRMEQMMLAHTDTSEVKEVTLVVSDRKKVELANNARVAYNSSGQVSVNSVKLKEPSAQKVETSKKKPEPATEYNQLIVPKGRRSMVVLADNSKMWVNSGSKVIYPRTFNGSQREIFVEGEVYLQVARDEAKPFVVNTSAFDVEVLGTSFNVSAYKGQAQPSVVLVEGAVDVKDAQSDKHVRMRPNERVQLDEAGALKKDVVEASDYIHWVDGIWVLNGKPLKEVLEYLSEYYGKQVTCDPSIADELFYGKLFLNEELDKVLESIWRTLPEELNLSREAIGVVAD